MGGGISQVIGRQRFAAFHHPIIGKQHLVLGGNRAGEAQHDVYPRRVFGFHQKLGVGAVLAAAIGDGIVDHHDFAVVAQVDAAGMQRVAAQAVAHGHRHFHPSLLHGLPMWRSDEGARTDGIHDDAAGHAAAGGFLYGLNDFLAIVVGEPNVKRNVYAGCGHGEIADHGVYAGIGVGSECGLVACHHRKAIDAGAGFEGILVARRHAG